MVTDVDAALVAAARDGDSAAVEELVAAYLPLVYNIVGRALSHGVDVDDTVQEVMLRIVRGLPELRDPTAFRSWLVAITMNQIRRHRRHDQPEPQPLEVFDSLPDLRADFTELTIWKLGLTGQRMETAQAAAWLDDDHRELLSLWWLMRAGQLTRIELVAALDLDPHVVTVRIGRMKEQLDTARGIVRALNTGPRCPELARVTAAWTTGPSPLWRKRIARHLKDCDHCLTTTRDLLPVEGLLVGLTLVPISVGLTGLLHSRLPSASASPWRSARRASPRRAGSGQRGLWMGKLTGAVVAATAIGGTAAMIVQEYEKPTAPPPSSPSPWVSVSPRTPGTAAPAGGPTAAVTAEEQVLAVINQARAGQGLPPLTRTVALNRSASDHTRVMLSGCGLNHLCPGEPELGSRASAAGGAWGTVGENIGGRGPVDNTPEAIAAMAVGLTNAMLAEQPPAAAHRQNLLSSAFHRIGISVLRADSGAVWMTQDFSD